MNYKFKAGVLASAIALALGGCGSSSSGSSTPAATTFNVAVDAPNVLQTASTYPGGIGNFFMSSAIALTGSDLSSENFTVVIVDPQGNVIEEVTVSEDNIEQLPDGTWEISVPGDPRLDCLIVVDVNGPVEIVIDQPIPSDNLFAPTTAVDIEVDIASTAAYQNFIEELGAGEGATFESLGYDVDDAESVEAVESIVERVQEVFEELVNDDLLDLTTGTLDSFLAAIEETVTEIIEQEIENVVNATSGTIAELVQSGAEGAGIYWYEAEYNNTSGVTLDVDFIERGVVPVEGVEMFYEYDSETHAWVGPETFDPANDDPDDDYVLTSTGWQATADAFEIASVNADGTVTIQDAAVNSATEILGAAQVIDLEDRNIEEFMELTGDFSLILESDALFSAGAKAYRLTVEQGGDRYELWNEPGEEGVCPWNENTSADTGGNCETVALLEAGQWQGPITSLEVMTVDTAVTVTGESADDTNFVGVIIEYLDNDETIVAELVEGETNVANFYLHGPNDGYTSLGSGSWSTVTPTGLPEGQELILIPLPEDVMAEGDFDDGESKLYGVLNEHVRPGSFYPAGNIEEESTDWVFNSTANTDILAAVDFDFLDTLDMTGGNQDESEWDDTAYDGFGGPTGATARTYKAFDRSVELSRDGEEGNFDFTAAELSGNTFYTTEDETTFNADGTGESIEGEESISFDWSINEDGFLILEYTFTDIAGDSQATYSATGSDIIAKVPGTSGGLDLKIFYQLDLWQEIGPGITDAPEISANQGEIWTNVWYDEQPVF